MFIMKPELLISLLCVTLSVSAAAVVPVESVVPEEGADVSVPVVPVEAVAPEESADVSAAEDDDVQEERAELSVPDDSAGVAREDPLRSIIPRDGVPPPFIQARTSSNCPQGWQQHQDACYRLVNLTYSRTNAEFLCESLGSSLAAAHNLQDYSFLQRLTWRAGFTTAWIGGYKFQGYWRWDDGTPFDYNNWYSHSSSRYDECLYLNSQDTRGWSNSQCHFGHPFICSSKLIGC